MNPISPEKIESINQHAQGLREHATGIAYDVKDETAVKFDEAKNDAVAVVEAFSNYIKAHPLKSVGLGVVAGSLLAAVLTPRR